MLCNTRKLYCPGKFMISYLILFLGCVVSFVMFLPLKQSFWKLVTVLFYLLLLHRAVFHCTSTFWRESRSTLTVLWLAWGQQSLFQPIKITITVRDTNRNTLLLVSSTTQMVWLKHIQIIHCTDCPLSRRILLKIRYKFFPFTWWFSQFLCLKTVYNHGWKLHYLM